MLTRGRLEVCKHRSFVACTQRACVLNKKGVDESHPFFIIKVGRRTINLIKINYTVFLSFSPQFSRLLARLHSILQLEILAEGYQPQLYIVIHFRFCCP